MPIVLSNKALDSGYSNGEVVMEMEFEKGLGTSWLINVTSSNQLVEIKHYVSEIFLKSGASIAPQTLTITALSDLCRSFLKHSQILTFEVSKIEQGKNKGYAFHFHTDALLNNISVKEGSFPEPDSPVDLNRLRDIFDEVVINESNDNTELSITLTKWIDNPF